MMSDKLKHEKWKHVFNHLKSCRLLIFCVRIKYTINLKGLSNLAQVVTILVCIREVFFRISLGTPTNLNEIFRGFPHSLC
jgi:hypothetical protein